MCRACTGVVLSSDERMYRMKIKSKNLWIAAQHHAAMTALPLIALTFIKKRANTQVRPTICLTKFWIGFT